MFKMMAGAFIGFFVGCAFTEYNSLGVFLSKSAKNNLFNEAALSMTSQQKGKLVEIFRDGLDRGERGLQIVDMPNPNTFVLHVDDPDPKKQERIYKIQPAMVP